MKKPIVGVLGGLGPETTAKFYQSLIHKATTTSRPAVCIWSLPLNLQKEKEYIASGQHTSYYFHRLSQGQERLARAGCTHIVIPCNTVHEFYESLQATSPIPLTNIIELTAAEVARRGWTSCTVLMTSRTRATGLYQHALAKHHVAVSLPHPADQCLLDQAIMGLLGKHGGGMCGEFLQNMLARIGNTHIVLGCTDLQLACMSGENIVDSMDVLASHTAGLAKATHARPRARGVFGALHR
ncbi:aspartate/glutamate racemase family protein [Candidatus Uhrbacteria bacterium]|nr:aspartate/glutamate racemase family protein [Candidatus Uhrbacteria bacterium]